MGIGERGVVAQSAHQHEAVPLLLDDQLARARTGIAVQKLAAQTVAVRSHHVSAGDIGGRHVGDIVPHVVRIAKAERINVVIAHLQPHLFPGRKNTQAVLDHGWVGDRIHVRDGVFEAEVDGTGVSPSNAA